MKKDAVLPILLLAATLILAVVSYLLLPATVITQLSLGGSGATTMPKLIAVALPTLLGAGGAAAALFTKREGQSKNKPLLVSAIGVVLFIIMLAVNL